MSERVDRESEPVPFNPVKVSCDDCGALIPLLLLHEHKCPKRGERVDRMDGAKK